MSSEYLLLFSVVLLFPGVKFTSAMLGCSCVYRDCDIFSMTGGMFTIVSVPSGQLSGRVSVVCCSIADHVFLVFCMTTSAHVEVDGMLSCVLYVFGSGNRGTGVPTHCMHSRWRAARHMKQGPYGLLLSCVMVGAVLGSFPVSVSR